MKRFYIFTILSGIFLTNVFADVTPVRYVKTDGTGDGTSWANASGDLQAMINASTDGDEIWVAAGTYRPNRKADDPDNITPDDRDNAFVLKEGVKIYGGFPDEASDIDHTSLTSRDWKINVTILSGDLNNDGDVSGIDENAYHVVIGVNLSASTVLDGFTITGGNADGDGSILCNGQEIHQHKGGGMVNSASSSPTLTNVTIMGNTASDYGGGMYNSDSSSPTLTNVAITGNTAGFGGGMYNSGSSFPMLTNVVISGNTADGNGGGMYNSSSTPTLTNVIITGNTAAQGGGMVNNDTSTPTLTNVTIAGNTASQNGGGMLNSTSSDPQLCNVILWGNEADTEPGVYNYDSYGANNPSYSYCLIQGIEDDANNCIDASQVEDGDVFVDAVAGDYYLKAGSPAIDAGNDACNSEPLDLNGKPRIIGSAIDMGAYERVRYYVKEGGDGNQSGTSWANASGDLQAMINAAAFGDEIWVAAGTYKPAYTAAGYNASANTYPVTNGNRDNAFVLKNGVKIYGGFPDDATTDANRDWATNETILSGDFDNDDSGNAQDGFSNMDENAYHVIIGVDLSANTVLDGFIITGGNADDYASILCNGQSINQSSGGGMLNDNSSPTLTNVTIKGNKADYGGGMYNITDSSPMLTGVVIAGNTASFDGGGMYNAIASEPTLANVTIAGNTAGFGGGMYNFDSSPQLYNTILWGNEAGTEPGVYNNDVANNPLYSYCLIQGRDGDDHCIDASQVEDGDVFVDAAAGDYHLKAGSPAIDAGNNVHNDKPLDLDGKPRIIGSAIDMGAYEHARYYVKQSGNGNGDSWTNASGDLQAMINAAASGDEIRVAAGTYKPNRKANDTGTIIPNDRNNAFVLKNGVKIYGGFPDDATDATTDADRDLEANTTTLSGDFTGNDTDGFSNMDENAYHVIIGVALSANTVLDGFTITGGNAAGGSSILCNEQNIEQGNGGGMYNIKSSSPTLTNVVIKGNTAGDGGGIYNCDSSSPTLSDVVITENTAAYGGGIYNRDSSSPTLIRVAITGNTAQQHGGGMNSYNYSSPTLTNVTITENTAGDSGGGMSNFASSSPTLTNVTITRNTADNGGGMFNDNSFPHLYNTILWVNQATRGEPGVEGDSPSYLYFYSYCLIQDRYDDSEDCIDASSVDNVDDVFVDAAAGDYRLKDDSPAIDAGSDAHYQTAVNAIALKIPGYDGLLDLAGNVRKVGAIDLGAYEYGSAPPDLTLPTLSDGKVRRISDTEAEIDFTTDEAGTAYYLVLESGDTAPTKGAVKAGGTSLGPVEEGESNDMEVTLTEGIKDIYVIVEDAAGNISEFLKIEAPAYDPTAPTLTAGTVDRTSDTEATISFTTDEAGTAYYLVLDKDETAPTKDAVKADGISLGPVEQGEASDVEVTLTEGAKDIYVVVEDAAGNISDPLKIAVPIYDITAPALSAGTASRASSTNATIGFITDEAGTAYCLIASSGSYTPAKDAVKDVGISLGVVEAGEVSVAVTLEDADAKDIYVIVEDAAGNISNPLKIAVPAYVDVTAPALSAGTVSRTGDTDATIGFTTDEAGTAYGFAVSGGSYAPAKDAVKEFGTSLGAVEAGAVSDIAVTLADAGAKDIYVIVEDAAGNISVPLKIVATAYPDVTAPTLSATNASDTTQTGVTLNFITDEAGTSYYLVYAEADAAPDAALIKAQGTAVAKGTAATAEAGANTAVTVVGLTASTAYRAYVIVEDAAGNRSAVAAIAFTTFAAPDRHIELSLPDDGLTVHIRNTGTVETGILKLALSGTNADVFTFSSATINSIPVGGEADITLTLRAGLPVETYTATLTVSGEGFAPVSLEITCTPTGNDNPPSHNPLKAWMRGATLHVSGLTAGRAWSVYSISGTLLHRGIAVAGEADVALPVRGIYVITSGDESIKTVY